MSSDGTGVDWTGLLAAWDLAPCEPRLRQFREDLLRFNRGRNLVSRASGADHVSGLILESVAAARALAPRAGARLLDLGSGAGLPGIPMAIVCPGIHVDLLERRSTRCDFLRRECQSLPVGNAAVLEADARRLDKSASGAGAYAMVLLKAVAQPAAALALARPLLAPGGVAVLFARAAEVVGTRAAESSAPGLAVGWTQERALPLEPLAEHILAGALIVLRPL